MAAYLEKLVQPERRDRDALKGGLKELRFLFGGNVNAVTGAAATLVVLSRNAARLPPQASKPEAAVRGGDTYQHSFRRHQSRQHRAVQWPTDTACGPNALRGGSSEAEAVRTGPCERLGASIQGWGQGR